MRRLLVWTLVPLAGCGGLSGENTGATTPRSDPGPVQRYEARAVVLESEEHGPMLCLSMLLESLPPQCGDVPLSDWDWNAVPGEERLSGTTWGGEYRIVGTYDGDSFLVEEAAVPQGQPPFDDGDRIDTPCEEPDGGWSPVDPSRSSEADRQAATDAASAEPDFAGLWVDYMEEPDPDAAEDPGTEGMILNVAFTGDVERHREELGQLWGGPLCVVQHRRTEAELRRIQGDLEPSADQLGIQILWSSVEVVANVVEVGVVVIDAQGRAALDELYGPGAVRPVPALTPID